MIVENASSKYGNPNQTNPKPNRMPLIQRIHEIDRELEQIELAIELERQMDS